MQYAVRHSVPYLASMALDTGATTLSTVRAQLLAWWWGVRLGSSCTFTGVPLFRKHPTGRISIGQSCTFRSAEWSNSIGINRRCFLSAGRQASVQIGSHCGFSGTIISASTMIDIGDHVLCGANCTICDSDRHPLGADDRRHNTAPRAKPIHIDDDVFLGMNVVVLKGVAIGKRTVVAANSVVIDSLPSDVLAAGIPAKAVRCL